MGYFQTKRDLGIMRNFKKSISELWEIENETSKKLKNDFFYLTITKKEAIKNAASKNEKYQQIREKIAKYINEVSRIANRYGIQTIVKSYPAPVVGGPVIPIDIFYSVLHDYSHHGIDRQLVWDKINETIGECEADLKKEFYRLFNPLYWIQSIIVFIIRIPFMLISVSGFNIDKIEDHFISKLFKLIELLIIILFILKLGFSKEELKQVILGFFSK